AAGRQVAERLSLDQRDVARIHVVEVAIAHNPAARVGDRLVDLVRQLAVHGRDVDRLDPSLRPLHAAPILAATRRTGESEAPLPRGWIGDARAGRGLRGRAGARALHPRHPTTRPGATAAHCLSWRFADRQRRLPAADAE